MAALQCWIGPGHGSAPVLEWTRSWQHSGAGLDQVMAALWCWSGPGHGSALLLQLQLFIELSSCRGRCLLPLQMALETKNTKLGQSALTGMQVNQHDHPVVVGVK